MSHGITMHRTVRVAPFIYDNVSETDLDQLKQLLEEVTRFLHHRNEITQL